MNEENISVKFGDDILNNKGILWETDFAGRIRICPERVGIFDYEPISELSRPLRF